MIDWEEIIRTESTEELKEAKLWLFQENIRLQQERTELEQAKDKFLEERVTLRDELDALNRRTVMERKRLKEESLFFEKKNGNSAGRLPPVGRGSEKAGKRETTPPGRRGQFKSF